MWRVLLVLLLLLLIIVLSDASLLLLGGVLLPAGPRGERRYTTGDDLTTGAGLILLSLSSVFAVARK